MKIFVFIGTFLFLISCNESIVPTKEALGKDYYPVSIGQYRVYDVQEINYKLTGFDTSFYQLRETIFDSLVSQDQVSYLIRRDKRTNALEQWSSDSVWTASVTQNYLAISENNVPFMKLTFPVKIGKEWDGNSLNSKAATTYYYTSVDEQLVDSVSLDNHIRLIVEDIAPNIVNQDERSEIYVRGIGLVQKHYMTLQFCTVDCNELGEIEAGRFLNQVLIEAGDE